MVLQGNAVANGWGLPEANSNERISLLIVLLLTGINRKSIKTHEKETGV